MINSTLCYIEKNGKWLMLNRCKKKNDVNQGKWIGVGGKFEEKESPDECLLREVKEETGLKLLNYKLRGIVTFVSDRYETEQMFLYTSDLFEGTLTDCNEGVLEWVPIEKITDLNLWDGDRLFLDYLFANRDFFTLRLEYVGDRLISVK